MPWRTRSVDDIEAIVRPCGLGKSKARDISACMKILKEKYGGKVPDDFDELLALPGVGPQERQPDHGRCSSAKPAIVTDTHCIRLVQPHRSGGWHQRTQEGGDGSLEDYPPGGGQRLLPSPGHARAGRLHRQNRSPLRPLLSFRHLQKKDLTEMMRCRNEGFENKW